MQNQQLCVLILILLEYTLQGVVLAWCTTACCVLILILLEYTLHEIWWLHDDQTCDVLILILLEYTLQEQILETTMFQAISQQVRASDFLYNKKMPFSKGVQNYTIFQRAQRAQKIKLLKKITYSWFS